MFGIETFGHNFLYPFLALYDTESCLPDSMMQPAAKPPKLCYDISGVPVEQKLKFKSTHELLSYSMCTNVPSVESEIFECRREDSEEAIKKLDKNSLKN